MFHNQLSCHQYDHSKQCASKDQLSMPECLQELSGQVGNDQSQKGDRSHHRRRHRDADRHSKQKSADRPVIVHAQVHRLLSSKGDDVQKRQIFSQMQKSGLPERSRKTE